jgi:hypothetical protein
VSTAQYEVYAIKYAHHARTAKENFLGGDPHDGPMPMDYFVWLIRCEGRDIVVDTGFNVAVAAKRARRVTLPVEQGLALMGVEVAGVKDVAITHLHYDHVGNFDLFPAATFHLQDLEMQYATGRCMTVEAMRHAYEPEDVVGMVRRVYAGRVRFHDGDGEIAPGVTLHHVGAAGWCWHRMPATTTPTWSRPDHFRSSTTSATWSKAGAGRMPWPILRRTSSLGTTRWCWSATRPPRPRSPASSRASIEVRAIR